jgi:hypothetical protein
MIELSILHQQLLNAAANLDEQLCDLIELRQRLKKTLSARYHDQKLERAPAPDVSSAARSTINPCRPSALEGMESLMAFGKIKNRLAMLLLLVAIAAMTGAWVYAVAWFALKLIHWSFA